MAFARGFAIGAQVGQGRARSRLDRERFELEKATKEAIMKANEDNASLLKVFTDQSQAEQESKLKISQFVQPLADIVSKKPGPQRSGEVEVLAQSLQQEGITLSPIVRNILEKEKSEIASPMMKQIQRDLGQDPTASLEKYGPILESDLQATKFLNETSKVAQTAQLEGKPKPNLEKRRLAEIQILQSKNQQARRALSNVRNIGGAAEPTRRFFNNIINQNNTRLRALQEVTESEVGTGVIGETRKILRPKVTAQELGQVGDVRIRKGGTEADIRLTRAQKGKRVIDVQDAEIALRDMFGEAENITNIITEGGGAGAAASVFKSLDATVGFTEKMINFIGIDDKTTGNLKVESFFPKLRKQGVLDQRAKNSILAFAKMIAVSEGDTGKGLSDRDLALILNRVGDTSSKEQLIASIDEEIQRAKRRFLNKFKVITGQDFSGELPETKQAKTPETFNDLESIQNEIDRIEKLLEKNG
jgi:hypothetical protein